MKKWFQEDKYREMILSFLVCSHEYIEGPAVSVSLWVQSQLPHLPKSQPATRWFPLKSIVLQLEGITAKLDHWAIIVVSNSTIVVVRNMKRIFINCLIMTQYSTSFLIMKDCGWKIMWKIQKIRECPCLLIDVHK